MSEDKESVPEIRFPEFTDAWEQRKLGEVTDYIKGFAFKSTDYKETGARIIRVSDLSKDDIKDTSDNTFIDFDDYHLYVKYRINYGDIIITTVGSKAEMKASAVGRPIIVKKTENYLLNQNLVKVNPKKGYVSYFIYCQLLPNKYSNYLAMIERGNANQANIAINDLWGYVLQVPSKEEQAKIGTFFKDLDNVITLHQRKLKNIKKLKKGLLQKMFPKKEEDFPEVRFPGFTDTWEQRRLVDVAEFNPKSGLPELFKYVDLESVVGTEMISFKEERRETAPSRAQRLARQGDLFYQTVRPYQKNNYLFEKPLNNYVFSTGYTQMRPYGDSYFLLSLVQNELFVKAVLDRCTGTSYPAINSKDLALIEISSAVDDEEQIKIGMLFKQLDNLITLHQRKLEHLKEQKKTLLRKMFI